MAKLGYGFYAGIPSWILPYTADGWQLWMDPTESNPFGHDRVIGRVPTDGDTWEHGFVARGVEGGVQFGQFCQRAWDKSPWIPYWVGPNEPPATTLEDARRLCAFYQGFAGYAHSKGRKVLAGSFSVTRPDEHTFAAYAPMIACCDGLALHEYARTDLRDPSQRPWYVFKYRWFMEVLASLGLQPDVHITELNLDDGTGWQTKTTAVGFGEQLRWYALEAAQNAYVKSLIIFAASSYSFPTFLTNETVARICREINAGLPEVQAQQEVKPVTPPVDINQPAVRPLPGDEPNGTLAFLIEKGRYWFEKYTRCIEPGNEEYDPGYGRQILYSLIDQQKGPLYRAERLAKSIETGPKAYSQRDPRWASSPLGTAGGTTIGTHGCLLTAIASCLHDLDIETNPDMLNAWLSQHGGYESGNLFRWYAVQPLGVRLENRIECENVEAPIGVIQQALANGQAVVAEVDFKPGGAVEQHWVRILSIDSQDALIMDPWQEPGKEMIHLSKYFAPGWNTAKAIMGVGIYRKG